MAAKGQTRAKTAQKLSRLRALMQARGLDGIVLSSYQNVSYFGGTTVITQVLVPDRLGFLVARRDGAVSLLVCNIETSQVRTQTDIEDVREYVEFAQNPTEELAKLLKELDLAGASVGFDARRLPAAALGTLQSELPGLELVAIDDELELAQSEKDADDIKALEHAARITLRALSEGLRSLSPGLTERQVAGAVYSRLMESGGSPSALIFASGERTMQAHPEASEHRMETGTLWRIDFGGRFAGGLVSDLARTGVVGHSTPEQEAILTALRATQDAGFRAMEPGRPAKEVFFAVKDEFKRQGLPFWMPHIGHGMGIAIHEYPMLEPSCEIPLKVGMVLNVEPMVLLPERGDGYHTEDLAVITDNGPRCLTPPQERLLIIPG
jgi:Xaa-Pro dipeptidase